MKLLLASSLIFLSFQFHSVFSFQDCPLLGPDFPAPTRFDTPTIQNARSALQAAINDALKDGSLENSTSSFSVNIFSPHNSESLFTFHHSADNLNGTEGVTEVDSDSVYRIASVSKLFTLYVFLIEAGDSSFNDPITRYVPELASSNRANSTPINSVDWESITVGNLASQMSGIGRDYLFDLQLANSTVMLDAGFPPLSSELPDCVADGICNRTESFSVLQDRHPVFPPATTPMYDNVAYQLLAYAIENITGKPFLDMLNDDVLTKLGMNSTSYTLSNSTTRGVVPWNASYSSWDYDLGDLSPTGNIYSSVRDMAIFGKSILESTLLSPAQTRRWMKPLTHTSDIGVSVGAPWQILRRQSEDPRRVVDLYTKDGEIGLYETQFALIPDWDLGFVVFQAGTSYNARLVANMISEIFLPAVETAAREEADVVYSGTYVSASASLNSSITITTDPDHLGLGVTAWVSNGTDMLDVLANDFYFNDTSVRLYPTGLQAEVGGEVLVAWRAVFGLKATAGDGIFSQTCTTWAFVDNYRYGGRGIDEFVFTLGSDNTAKSVEPRAFRAALQKVNATSRG